VKLLVRFDNFSKLDISLLIFVVISLCIKWLYLIHVELNSDTVHPALLSQDIRTYGFQVLTQYRLPSDDPYLFSDTLFFHLPIHFFLNFSLIALKISSFLIFILIICVFSLIVFFATKKKIIALSFAAFFTALPPSSSLTYMTPIFHNGTIFFIGLLFLLFWYTKKNYHYTLILTFIITGLAVFSDSIIIMWFFIPFYIVLFHFDKEELNKNKYTYILILFISIIIFLIKKFFIPTFRHHMVTFTLDPSAIVHNFFTMSKIYVYFYNEIFFSLTNWFNIFFASAIVILSIIIVYESTDQLKRKFPIFHLKESNRANIFTGFFNEITEINLLKATLIFCIVIPSIIFILSDYANFGNLRYLSFSFLAALLVFFFNLKIDNPRIVIPLLLLIIVNIGIGINTIASMSDHNNSDSNQLLNSLIENNLTFGYGDYWDANYITYLSHGAVTMRPVTYRDNDIFPFEWLTCDCWYRNPPSDYFLLVGERNSDLHEYTREYPPTRVLIIKNYSVYLYTNHTLPSISSFNYVTFDEKIQFFLDKIHFPREDTEQR